MSLPALEDTLAEPAEPERAELELGELYPATSFGALRSFVGHNGHQRWVWLALCKATRRVVRDRWAG